MTASKLYTIFCDAESCGWWVEGAGVGDTAGEARGRLKRGGWAVSVKGPYKSRLDYCPKHAHLAAGGETT